VQPLAAGENGGSGDGNDWTIGDMLADDVATKADLARVVLVRPNEGEALALMMGDETVRILGPRVMVAPLTLFSPVEPPTNAANSPVEPPTNAAISPVEPPTNAAKNGCGLSALRSTHTTCTAEPKPHTRTHTRRHAYTHAHTHQTLAHVHES
jgi:hypothetical protein